MADRDDASTPLDVTILAGRLGVDDDGWPLGPLLDRLERRGIAPRVVCTGRADRREDPRITVVPALGRRWMKMVAVRRLAGGRSSPRPAVLHALHEETADVALALAETWRVPYLQTVDDFLVAEDGLRVSRRRLHAFVASSEELRDVLIGDLGVPPELIAVVPPGVVAEPLTRPPGGEAVPVVGIAGPPLGETGFAPFLEAAALVLGRGRDVEFLLAVQGGDSFEVRRHAQALKIQDRVTVTDFDLVGPRLWSVLDAYCQPALEASAGRTLTLALVQGVPSVASSVRGLRGLIEPGRSGLLVPPDDAPALADAIARLLDDRDAARVMADAAQSDLRARFDIDVEADKLAALYRAAAAETRSDAPAAS